MIKLHLMDDRNVIASRTVGDETLAECFYGLMNALKTDVDENYVSEYHDPDGIVKAIMKGAADKALSLPVTRESIVAFSTGDPAYPQDIYSVVYYEADNG